MIIGERALLIQVKGVKSVRVPIQIFAPVQTEKDWSCSYSIGWPEGRRSFTIYGIDSMQALTLALQAVGSEIYASRHHANGSLFFEKKGLGYGFPVAATLRDMLIGDDKREFGIAGA